jgi:hypothetical protein
LADGRRARKVNLEEKVGLLEGVHSPDIVGYLDHYNLALVRIEGEFLWHKHDDADDFFFVLCGRMIIRPEKDPDVLPSRRQSDTGLERVELTAPLAALAPAAVGVQATVSDPDLDPRWSPSATVCGSFAHRAWSREPMSRITARDSGQFR